MNSINSDDLIIKKILHPGTKNVDFKSGTKVHFHFQTRLCNDERTVIDDTRKMGKGNALELVLGKKFKLEVWEAIVQRMSLNEVASFTVDKSLVLSYPFVSKTLRDSQLPMGNKRSHCCSMTLQTDGLGYDDLNALMKKPENLEFIIDLVKVEQPEDYKKELWQLDDDECLKLVPELKSQGNDYYKQKDYKQASDLYAKAIGILEQFMTREKPHDTEWNKLNEQKNVILLNYAQCKLLEKDYYAVIEHCSTVLSAEPGNVKALFRRAKAHAAVWNVDNAKDDFKKVTKLDPTLTGAVKKELLSLEKRLKEKLIEDKEKMKELFA